MKRCGSCGREHDTQYNMCGHCCLSYRPGVNRHLMGGVWETFPPNPSEVARMEQYQKEFAHLKKGKPQ